MRSAFNMVMRVVSSLLGILMVCMGGVWILQGLNIAFLNSFMANQIQWSFFGAILAAFGVGQVVWSNSRQ